MWKLVVSFFSAVAIFVFAGIEIQKHGFSGWPFFCALLSVGLALTKYTFKSHEKWCNEQNYSERVLCELDSNRVYAVSKKGHVGDASVSFLYDAVARKSVVYRGAFVPRGFHEIKHEDKVYLVPDGKILGFGSPKDFICVQPV